MLINCSECGKQVSDKAVSCPNCGCPIAKTDAAAETVCTEASERQDKFFERIERIERERHERELNRSDKSRIAYVLLGLFLGVLGIHNFYAGHAGRGTGQIVLFVLGMMLTFIGIGFLMLLILGIWILVDICSVSTDGDGRQLS